MGLSAARWTALSDRHEHPVDAVGVAAARARVLPEGTAREVVDALRLLADPVRARIVMALSTVRELCVGDLALVLGVSGSSVSHALRLLRAGGIVDNRREGRVIYYRLADTPATAVLDLLAGHVADGGDGGDGQ